MKGAGGRYCNNQNGGRIQPNNIISTAECITETINTKAMMCIIYYVFSIKSVVHTNHRKK